jgi:hypothetical protein
VAHRPSRQQRLRSLRQQEHARAVAELERAEDVLARIDAELDRLRRRIAELEAGSATPEPGSVSTAGLLVVGSRSHQRDREQRARLAAEERAIGERREAARVEVGAAQDRVAATVRALRALEEP